MNPTTSVLATLAALLVAPALAPASASASAVQDGEVYRRMARECLTEWGYGDASEFVLEGFLEEHFARVDLGLFRVHVTTRALGDRGHADGFEEAALGLLDLQDAWIRWATAGQPDAGAAEPIREDLETVRDWVESWSRGDLEDAGATDLVTALEADEETAAAAARLQAYMVRGASLGLEREGGEPEPIVFIPDRARYVRAVALAGLVGGSVQRSSCWTPNIINFTEFYWGQQTLVLPFEYSVVGATLDDYGEGTPMDKKSKTGLQQQVDQIAANVLLDNHFGSKLPGSLAGGIALNLIIDLYGECNTRVDGDPSARRTDGLEFFVPGGQSEGGVLPSNLADSRWRARGSKDRFKTVLKAAQKAGAKDAERGTPKNAAFRLQNDERTRDMVVAGPFLGSAANPDSLAVPGPFYGDQLEFLRSYRSGFVHFLRAEAMRREDDSAAAFAGLLREIVRLDDPSRIEEVVAEAYDAPALSTAALEEEELEARFLRWISR